MIKEYYKWNFIKVLIKIVKNYWCKIKLFFLLYKINYYRKNREIYLKKWYDKYHYKGGKEKAANYY